MQNLDQHAMICMNIFTSKREGTAMHLHIIYSPQLLLKKHKVQISRVPQCLFPRPNWDPPRPRRVCPPPGTKGQDTLACG
jgi:hypothetical protein